jgi:hypothetical protein
MAYASPAPLVGQGPAPHRWKLQVTRGHSMRTSCTHHAHSMRTACTLDAHSISTGCALHTHRSIAHNARGPRGTPGRAHVGHAVAAQLRAPTPAVLYHERGAADGLRQPSPPRGSRPCASSLGTPGPKRAQHAHSMRTACAQHAHSMHTRCA